MALWSSRRTLLIVLGIDFSESKIIRKVEMFRLRLNMTARAQRSTWWLALSAQHDLVGMS